MPLPLTRRNSEPSPFIHELERGTIAPPRNHLQTDCGCVAGFSSLVGLITTIGIQAAGWDGHDLGTLNALKSSNGWVITSEWAGGALIGAIIGYAAARGLRAARSRQHIHISNLDLEQNLASVSSE